MGCDIGFVDSDWVIFDKFCVIGQCWVGLNHSCQLTLQLVKYLLNDHWYIAKNISGSWADISCIRVSTWSGS